MNLAQVRGVVACLLLLLTTTSTALAQVERYVEGVHYQRLPEFSAANALGAPAGQKSVLEIFWYGCNHCYAFDPLLNAWVAGKGDTLVFSRMPMIWDANTKQHARLFFTTQALRLHERMHARIFDTIHKDRNYLLDKEAIGALFGAYGVDATAFAQAFTSFSVDAELRKTEARQREVFIPSVPALIVNGTYLINIDGDHVRTQQAMLDVADFLLDKN